MGQLSKMMVKSRMPKINVNHNSSLQTPDASAKIREFFETDKDLKTLDPKLQVTFDEKTGKGKVTGSQFKAELAIEPQAEGSLVKVMIDLPLMLTPFKGKVEEMLQKKLKKYLA